MQPSTQLESLKQYKFEMTEISKGLLNMDNETLNRKDVVKFSDKQRAYGIFYQGGWKTSNTHTRTTITPVSVSLKKRFHVESIGYQDGVHLKYRVIVDNKIMIPEFGEGSSVIVEGRSVELEQLNDGNNFHAVWKSLDEDEEPLDIMTWSIVPRYGNDAFLTHFTEENEFILELGHINWGDNNAYMRISVDGEYLTDNKTGVPWEFLQGTSVIAKGKTISVSVTPTNNNQREFFGRLIIRS